MWNLFRILVIITVTIGVYFPILAMNMQAYSHNPDYANSTVYAYGYPYTTTDCYGVSKTHLGNTELPVTVLMHLTTPTPDGYANVEFQGLCPDRKYIIYEHNTWGSVQYTIKMVNE